eukprot:m.30501 g.30501  ORF g.30501 m.30501 type:complete len:884 (+) comp4717_c0_seq1:66-2717(+)
MMWTMTALPLVPFAVVSAGVIIAPTAAVGTVTLKNEHVRIDFTVDPERGDIAVQQVADVTHGSNGAIETPSTAMWELQLLTPQGVELCGPDNATMAGISMSPDNDSAILNWMAHCPGPSVIQVVQQWSLTDPQAKVATVEMRLRPCDLSSHSTTCVPLTPTAIAHQSAALWAVTFSVGGVGLGADGHVFYPKGYGETHAAGYGTVGSHTWAYPSAGCTMQFMAATSGGDASTGLYFAAHDGAAHQKYLIAHEHTTHSDTTPSPSESVASASTGNGGTVDCTNPMASGAFPAGPSRSPPNTQSLTITTVVENAGSLLNNSGYRLPFVFGVGPVATRAGQPMWYHAAEMYQAWALTGAGWTRSGPVAQRTTHFPRWFLDLNVWVNSGWQCYDRFNDTQGDPPTVLANARAINRRFNLSSGIGLHWYEWQCGFPDLCVENDGAHRFKFDTMYPDYDPPRRGDVFGDVVRQLKEEKVYTFPYINGRIFDNNSASFKTEDGIKYVVKQAAAPRLGDVAPLLECKESYGSEELDGQLVYFDVADPSTPYWQDKYAGQVSRLVNLSGVSGVYIDQLCAGAPVADWTPRSQHGVGGGAWWREGLVDLLAKAHARSMVDGVWSPLVVESNSEFLMDQANGLLTLSAFETPFAANETTTPGMTVFAPAFPAIYGGYFVGFGSIFTHNDLALNPDVFASRLAASFVWGIQLGWFSLGGVDHGPNLDTRCGPMYTLDSFLDPKHDPEVAFLQLLANSRGSMSRYFVHGRLVAPVDIAPTPKVFMAPAQEIMPRNKGPFPELSSSVWITSGNATGQSPSAATTLCVFLVASTSNNVPASFSVRPADYGLQGDAFAVVRVYANGHEEHVGSSTDGTIPLSRTVKGRDVEMLEVRPLA